MNQHEHTPPARPLTRSGARTQIRCHNCRTFFLKTENTCPECGTERRPVTVALESQMWRSQLNWHAQHTEKY